ncbi:hypothetical protein [Halobaculum sp. D14]|uniref:hypothetical protein n=1 Tax=Halobaculum sp. D14 TaxID=3421642 RepID=UPI003EB7C3F7
MVSTRLLSLLSTVCLVVGALLVGEALHISLVTGEVAVTSAPAVIQFVGGAALVLVGYRARRPVAERRGLLSDQADDDAQSGQAAASSTPEPSATDAAGASGSAAAADESSFDPQLSPLGDAAPGDAERDRHRDADGDADGVDREGRDDTEHRET